MGEFLAGLHAVGQDLQVLDPVWFGFREILNVVCMLGENFLVITDQGNDMHMILSLFIAQQNQMILVQSLAVRVNHCPHD